MSSASRRPDDVIEVDGRGLWCAAGGFHVDPWRPVPLAVVTHAHADHARRGSEAYLAASASVPLLERRLDPGAKIRGVAYGEPVRLGAATVSFHPAGHVLGSAQVRVEAGGEVWVVSGDYKRVADPTCAPFEVVACDTFITEATFALPIYRFPETARVAAQIYEWWESCREAGRPAVLFCYALGKSQRILAELTAHTDRQVYVHGALLAPLEAYREAGIALLPTRAVKDAPPGTSFAGELVVAPPSAGGSTWMRRFKGAETGFVSGWMRLRGSRRRRAVDRGFVLSDHADWPDLVRTVEETGARRVLTTHGYADTLARYLAERGLEAAALATAYEGEDGESV